MPSSMLTGLTRWRYTNLAGATRLAVFDARKIFGAIIEAEEIAGVRKETFASTPRG